MEMVHTLCHSLIWQSNVIIILKQVDNSSVSGGEDMYMC